ncbi:hypothetical protein A2415_03650 [candidate division WWE3 bacterium RIFOXYC1_FULL_39_7]|uniref:PDZ domain-containing protein n=2 Tax=Katanobacteria TaxID=422282 RepID=A0A1F4X837_UNCKA|nr:MAG: hypothetical protein A2415_03650 [candidate division WWE3 bacterium RIFOXYC1_FULL_39_7]OGC77701.1 MAG: hypothetical protein A2619_03275 [candidate division WWE3 bacterium RIFOXYD1_FULL_39_9]
MNAFEKFQRFLITILIAVSFFYGGYYLGKRGYIVEIRQNPPKIEVTNQYPVDSSVDFGLFWEVWDLVSKDYLERPVDPQKMVYGAISGMVASLGDPYTSYLPPQVNEVVSEALNGSYQGIGAELGLREGQLIIVAPIDGSPAKAVGLRSGDKILEIEAKSTVGMSISDAVALIRGAAGTKINLTIQTEDQEPRELAIVRGVINIASVSWENKGDGTAYIRINRFGGETNNEWSAVVSELNKEMPELDAVIVDVRGNPGGYLQSSIFIAEEFFRNKPVIYQESATGEQTPYNAKRIGAFTDVPAVFVLVDGGSASASEILAAALRDNISAKLVGTKSFGKGTIQDAQDFDDGSGVHITVAKWLTPKKIWVHQVGIEPDVVVERTDDDYNNNRDPQLDKALELARGF